MTILQELKKSYLCVC